MLGKTIRSLCWQQGPLLEGGALKGRDFPCPMGSPSAVTAAKKGPCSAARAWRSGEVRGPSPGTIDWV